MIFHVITLTFECTMDNEKQEVDWGLKELKLLVIVIVPNTTPLIEYCKIFLSFCLRLPFPKTFLSVSQLSDLHLGIQRK